MRVDMTVWHLLDGCWDLFGAAARTAQELVLAERLLRSARAGVHHSSAGLIQKSSDAEQGALWFAILHQKGAITIRDRLYVHADTEGIGHAIQDVLAQLYEAESGAAIDEASGQQLLAGLADSLRGQYLVEADGQFVYPPEVLAFLRTLHEYPHSAAVCFS